MKAAGLALMLVGCGASVAAPEDCAPPPIAPAAPKIMGFCPSRPVAERVAAGAKDIRACYEAALRRDPKTAGKVQLVWHIDAEGTATILGVQPGATLGDDCATACMTDAIGQWRFPPSPGGVCRVTFPFVFTPGR